MTILEHNILILLLAVATVSIACYAAIDVLNRAYKSPRGIKIAWVAAGSVVLASGLSSMTFLAVLAVHYPRDLYCNIPWAAASWLASVAAAVSCYFAAGSPRLTVRKLLIGATIASVGFIAQFYFSVRALNIVLAGHGFTASTIGAIVLLEIVAFTGIGVGYLIRASERWQGISASAGAGLMVGIGLAACEFLALTGSAVQNGPIGNNTVPLDANWVTVQIASTMVLVAALAIVATALDRRLHRQTSSLLSSLRASNEQLEYSSRHDVLTDLPNRTALHAYLEALLNDSRQAERVALLTIDIDGFRLINDNLGYVVGDTLLKRTGETLRTLLDERHMLARVTADEFVVVQHGVDTDEELREFAARINASLASISEVGTTLTASIGIAVFPDDAADEISLVSAANMAVQSAKRAGKNQAQRYLESMGTQRNEVFRLREELRLGISRKEMVVHYQPKYAASGDELVGAEALVRWQHPERGLVSPGVFIEIAERSGLIRDIEIQVLDMVCSQIHTWREMGYVVPPISVNLSVARLLDDELVGHLRQTLADHDLSPGDLILEITETLAMQEIGVAKRVLRQLNELGVQIALDDFGTGYSSLSYLQTLPIQQLKIDRSFIAPLESAGSRHNEIVKLIIDLAHVLDLTVVAEGVETVEQQAYLQEIACDQLQGFLLDRPMPAENLAERLTDRIPTAKYSNVSGN